MKIKICGLVRPEDVTHASALGADACGFVLAPSPRRITIEQLDGLLERVPSPVMSVAVMVDPTREEVDRVLSMVDRVQLHGQEPPDFCRRYGRRAWKAFRIRQPQDLDALERYHDAVGAFVLDSFLEGVAGGTGVSFPWSYLLGRSFPRITFLAGGLDPANVAEACGLDSVHGIDVSSGVEAEPGRKDPEKLRDFFAGARPHQAASSGQR